MRKIDLLVVHCSATPPNIDWGVDEIRDLHVNEFGWSDIGYHYVIKRDGTREVGRTEARIGAHCKGHNANSIGICLVGGVDENGDGENNFTDYQMDELHFLLKELIEQRHPEAKVLGHRDLSPDADGDGIVEEHEWLKECPCFDVREDLTDMGLQEWCAPEGV